MEIWQDQGVILAVRPYGESGAIVSALTESHGRQSGFMRGATSRKNRGVLEIGNIADIRWQARTTDNLGSFSLELQDSPAALIMQDADKLAALQSACALCDQALPDREGHAGLFHGFKALLDALQGEHWAPAYILWELSLLRELGFSLDLSACAGGGSDQDLAFVSPKTGRAVSAEKGAPYQDKLLDLPHFLRPAGFLDEGDFERGLILTGYFLTYWVFAQHSRGVPDARLRFQERFVKTSDVHLNEDAIADAAK